MRKFSWLFPIIIALFILLVSLTMVTVAKANPEIDAVANQDKQGTGVGPGLVMTKTVSSDGQCGVTDVITVTWKTSLTYCYTATNTGTVTLTTHTLTDTVLVSILDDFSYPLAPQASVAVTATFDPPNRYGLLENCALWTAKDDSGASIEAADCAKVYLVPPTEVSLTTVSGSVRPGLSWLLLLFLLVSGVLFRKIIS